ncbi:MAG TPA: NUDIX domain-containing protein [Candidatus Saccharimonadia bacterium]|jgi:ADP-ribose pyrophosphatase|nr:NUDIX domain-containing protein [Candidatus Saccharimonadia bacterium]
MRTITPANARLIPKDAKKVFAGQIFDVYHWEQDMFDGTKATFEMLGRPDTLQVLAVKDGKLVVLHEQQPGSKPFYGMPGGRHDHPGETELEAAKREMLEETGMTFKHWKLIEVVQPHTKIEWFVYLFVASGFEAQSSPHLDAGEKIEVELVSLERARELAAGPDVRHLPAELLESIDSLDDLPSLPEYRA